MGGFGQPPHLANPPFIKGGRRCKSMANKVPTIFSTSTFSDSHPNVKGSRPCKSSGAMIAEDPGRITINPSDTATFLLAIPAKGGPYGAHCGNEKPRGNHGVGIEQQQQAKLGRLPVVSYVRKPC
jgi:hypothetical protein